jgi:hypothetical protein
MGIQGSLIDSGFMLSPKMWVASVLLIFVRAAVGLCE